MNIHERNYLIWSTALSVFIILMMLCFQVKANEVDLTKAVIHHTASPCWTTVEDIDNWHKENIYVDKGGEVRHWDGIGYHYVILCDGTIKRGRDKSKKGAHAKGRNDRLGIALVGNDTFTMAQRESLQKFLNDIGIFQIEAHHKDCPGKGLALDNILVDKES